jgi:hypothetical protein
MAQIVPNHSAFWKRNDSRVTLSSSRNAVAKKLEPRKNPSARKAGFPTSLHARARGQGEVCSACSATLSHRSSRAREAAKKRIVFPGPGSEPYPPSRSVRANATGHRFRKGLRTRTVTRAVRPMLSSGSTQICYAVSRQQFS